VKHVYWLLNGLLAGRPGPVQAPWGLGELREAGLQALVSLNTEPDPTEVIKAGLRHHSLPMPPILPLSEAFSRLIFVIRVDSRSEAVISSSLLSSLKRKLSRMGRVFLELITLLTFCK